MSKKKFPNSFESWQETHYEIVEALITELGKPGPNKNNPVKKYYEQTGRGGMYELAEQWTDEFEKENKGREWDGEFMEAIWDFTDKKIKELK